MCVCCKTTITGRSVNMKLPQKIRTRTALWSCSPTSGGAIGSGGHSRDPCSSHVTPSGRGLEAPCLPAGDRAESAWAVWTVGCSSAGTKESVVPSATTWVDADGVLLDGVSPRRKCCSISLTCGVWFSAVVQTRFPSGTSGLSQGPSPPVKGFTGRRPSPGFALRPGGHQPGGRATQPSSRSCPHRGPCSCPLGGGDRHRDISWLVLSPGPPARPSDPNLGRGRWATIQGLPVGVVGQGAPSTGLGLAGVLSLSPSDLGAQGLMARSCFGGAVF